MVEVAAPVFFFHHSLISFLHLRLFASWNIILRDIIKKFPKKYLILLGIFRAVEKSSRFIGCVGLSYFVGLTFL